MRVLLADDQAKVRSALRLLLEQEHDIEVVGEAADAQSLLLQIGVTHPDLLLLDWELPGLSLDDRLLPFRAELADLRVIALSGRPESRGAALAAGADAFVSKTYPPDRLLQVLHTIIGKTDAEEKRGI